MAVDERLDDATAEDVALDANIFATKHLDVASLPVIVSACPVCSISGTHVHYLHVLLRMSGGQDGLGHGTIVCRLASTHSSAVLWLSRRPQNVRCMSLLRRTGAYVGSARWEAACSTSLCSGSC